MSGTLFIIATPIGNLKDITLRAVEVLGQVDLIACEDTRRTRILTQHYKIAKPLLSYYEYNKLKRTDTILEALGQGKNVALVSDAGTPSISDPGCSLVQKVLEAGYLVECIPGVTALIAALVLSGLPTHRFTFEGFLPIKDGARRRALERLAGEERTILFYESCHRLLKMLHAVHEVLGNRRVAVAREITKKFQEIRRETVSEAIDHFTATPPQGEFVVVLEPTKGGSHEREP